MQKLVEVRLYGHLGEKFGRRFKFAIDSPREAIQALTANFPEFREYLYCLTDLFLHWIRACFYPLCIPDDSDSFRHSGGSGS